MVDLDCIGGGGGVLIGVEAGESGGDCIGELASVGTGSAKHGGTRSTCCVTGNSSTCVVMLMFIMAPVVAESRRRYTSRTATSAQRCRRAAHWPSANMHTDKPYQAALSNTQ